MWVVKIGIKDESTSLASDYRKMEILLRCGKQWMRQVFVDISGKLANGDFLPIEWAKI